MAWRVVSGLPGQTHVEALQYGAFYATAPAPTHPGWISCVPGHGLHGANPALSLPSLCLCLGWRLGAAGAPLRPALLWMDMRSAQQAAQVAACGDVALEVSRALCVRQVMKALYAA